MSENRPFVLTLAGMDPSGGAGILADIKTFEQHKVYGLSVNTANTLQTEQTFLEMHWADMDFVLRSLTTLFEAYEIKAMKIGIVPSLEYLQKVLNTVRSTSESVKIVWDPVLRSSTGFNFITSDDVPFLERILEKTDLITPNYNELDALSNKHTYEEKIAFLSQKCPLLLKGGHHPKQKGTDFLYTNQKEIVLKPAIHDPVEKHGSGCVLAASIVSHLALGDELVAACRKAKNYVENFLTSNSSLLGYHHV